MNKKINFDLLKKIHRRGKVGDVELKNHDNFKLNLNLSILSNSEPWNIKDEKKGFRTLSGIDETYVDYLGRRK